MGLCSVHSLMVFKIFGGLLLKKIIKTLCLLASMKLITTHKFEEKKPSSNPSVTLFIDPAAIFTLKLRMIL
jgi:hypothetical protein